MMKKELAQLLGISGSMVSKLAKIGMPTDTLERAQRWRKRHLDPGRMKGTRFDPDKIRPTVLRPKPAALPQSEAVVRAIAMLNIAAVAHEAGQTIAPMVSTLRAALSAVPKPERENVGPLPLEVMNILVADVFAVCVGPDAAPPAGETTPMNDAEAQAMGEFWYQVAAGEWRAS